MRRIGMRRLIATLVAAAALVLTGCGSDDTDPAGGDPGQAESSEPAPAPEVDSVTLTRSGGFAGVMQTWKVGASDRGHRPVFEAASREALEGADTGVGKSPPCCDFFQYDLVIRYSNGSTATYRMYDGAAADPALDRLVNAVLTTKPQHSDTSVDSR